MALPFIVERRRCGAKRSNGLPCQAYPRRGKLRCRVHGGAAGSGRRVGPQNAAAMAKELTPVAEKPAEAMTDAELFADNFRSSLYFSREVLTRPIDWNDQDMLRLKRDVALGVQSQAIRIKVAELRPPADERGLIERLLARERELIAGGQAVEIDGECTDISDDAKNP